MSFFLFPFASIWCFFVFPPLLEGSIFDHSELIEVDPDVAKSWFEPVCFGSQLIATFDYIRSNDYPDTMLWSKKVSQGKRCCEAGACVIPD